MKRIFFLLAIALVLTGCAALTRTFQDIQAEYPEYRAEAHQATETLDWLGVGGSGGLLVGLGYLIALGRRLYKNHKIQDSKKS